MCNLTLCGVHKICHVALHCRGIFFLYGILITLWLLRCLLLFSSHNSYTVRIRLQVRYVCNIAFQHQKYFAVGVELNSRMLYDVLTS